MTKPTHSRRWRELRSTPENFERLTGALADEISHRRLTDGAGALTNTWHLVERSETFPAHAILASPRYEIRFVFQEGRRMFGDRRDPQKPAIPRPFQIEYLETVQWRHAKKGGAE